MPATQVGLPKLFADLKESRIGYCLIRNYNGLPFSYPRSPVWILTSDKDRVVKYLELQPNRPGVSQGNQCGYRMQMGDKHIDFFIVPKGIGLFPDRYEAEILRHAIEENGCKIPHPNYASVIDLYWAVFREGLWASTDQEEALRRRNLIRDLESKTGGFAAPNPIYALPLKNFQY